MQGLPPAHPTLAPFRRSTLHVIIPLRWHCTCQCGRVSCKSIFHFIFLLLWLLYHVLFIPASWYRHPGFLMHHVSISLSLLLFVPASLVISVVIGEIAVSRIRTVTRWRSRVVVGSFLPISFRLSFFLWRVRFGSSLRQIGHTLPYCSPVSIEITSPCHHRQGFFLSYFFTY
jgi:hypothetical protein